MYSKSIFCDSLRRFWWFSPHTSLTSVTTTPTSNQKQKKKQIEQNLATTKKKNRQNISHFSRITFLCAPHHATQTWKLMMTFDKKPKTWNPWELQFYLWCWTERPIDRAAVPNSSQKSTRLYTFSFTLLASVLARNELTSYEEVMMMRKPFVQWNSNNYNKKIVCPQMTNDNRRCIEATPQSHGYALHPLGRRPIPLWQSEI